MTRYVCIHGHFYQPPRENPWLEAVESQDSAYPYHDWNERITAECYAPNATSRILDERGRIVAITNNYARISFDAGPTLLTWMADKAPEVYAGILEADRDSQKRFSGHGSAIAQAYNHAILPLASGRDRRTQVVWGLADFVHRFQRQPEGMWLPETAVDVETLELLVEHGIRFTILAPHQARRVRRMGSVTWHDVDSNQLDTTTAYQVTLPSGRNIAVFFYDGPTSRAVAFEGLLRDGGGLAARLAGKLDGDRTEPQLIHIATDGESYGHHHRHGEMALAFALQTLEASPDVRLTNYGEFLERHPPNDEAEIVEGTSWSCAHGIERWRADCGCADGGHPEWNQSWREPLRTALDWLRDALAPRYERLAARYLKDPWAARDAYIDIILDRTPATTEYFLAHHAQRELDADERVIVWELLELQRHALLFYTSCGWFFDDLNRIETVQILRYAGRALQLAAHLFGTDLEPAFLAHLAKARSNDPEHGDGREVYEASVRPARIDKHKLAAHYAISSLFERYGTRTRIYGYEVTRQSQRLSRAGDAALATGQLQVTSAITGASAALEFGVLHLGDHNITGGVRDAGSETAFQSTLDDLDEAFTIADFPETVRRLDRHFGPSRYSLRTLFRDEQRMLLHRILDSSVAEARAAYRTIYRARAPLMRYLTDLGVRLPRTFHRAAEVAINDDLHQAFADSTLDPYRVRALLDDARTWELELDTAGLAHVLNTTIAGLTRRIRWELKQPPRSGPAAVESAGDRLLTTFERAEILVSLVPSVPFEVDLWQAQNHFYAALQRAYPELRLREHEGDKTAAAWAGHFRALGEALAVAVE
ncbi:MAG: DUF3536 domain-containing protein [Actinomycetota bacterium]|nr:DUF3536 domain-containing protein [Actinomycetota bacterium]